MKKLHSVRGSLDPDYVGQITYTISLEETYHQLDICLQIDPEKRIWQNGEITEAEIAEAGRVFTEDTGETLSREKLVSAVGTMKAEIHLLATLNDAFIGCIHRQMEERHMRFTPDTATEGCIPHPAYSGVLKATVLVFNVLKPDTRYTLSVYAE